MRHDAFLYEDASKAYYILGSTSLYTSILLPFCWSIWSLCTCYFYFFFLYGLVVVKQENYILLSLIKTCTQGIWGGKTNTVATTTICYKNQTPLLNIKYNTWMRILHERYVYGLYDQSLSIRIPFRVPSKNHQSPLESDQSLISDSSETHWRLIGYSLETQWTLIGD